MIQAAIVAPSLALRLGLSALLTSGGVIEVVADAAALPELLPLPAETRLLVIVTGSREPAGMERLRDETAAVLFLLSQQVDIAALLAGLGARPWGVLPLDATAEELNTAASALAEGLVVGSPALVSQEMVRLLSARSTGAQVGEMVAEPLTEREGQVLDLLARGLANKQIGASLGISEHTVKFHVSAIYTKLGASSRTEAVRLGVRLGLVVL